MCFVGVQEAKDAGDLSSAIRIKLNELFCICGDRLVDGQICPSCQQAMRARLVALVDSI